MPNHERLRAVDRIREDIDPANTWIVSDTHFGHDNIVGYCLRPEDHEQVMLAEWRAAVPDDATVVHLGDLCFKSNGYFKHIVAKELTGARKLLIRGNHDKNASGFYTKSGFRVCRPFSIMYGGRKLDFVDGDDRLEDHLDRQWRSDGWWEPSAARVSFAHYPWSADEDGTMRPYDLRLHGHIHNGGYTRDGFVPFLKQHINLSVEQTHYRPVNLKLLLDAVLLGEYPETTEAQHAEVAARKAGQR